MQGIEITREKTMKRTTFPQKRPHDNASLEGRPASLAQHVWLRFWGETKSCALCFIITFNKFLSI